MKEIEEMAAMPRELEELDLELSVFREQLRAGRDETRAQRFISRHPRPLVQRHGYDISNPQTRGMQQREVPLAVADVK